MMALVLCVLCSVMVSVLFKWARPRGLQAAQAVAVNYVVAIAATLVLLRPNIGMNSLEAMPLGFAAEQIAPNQYRRAHKCCEQGH